MAKLRVLLDEDVRADVTDAFGTKVRVETVSGLGLSGRHDKDVVEVGINRKALIVTANKDFVPQYRNHEWRKGKDGRHFWGLIFLAHSTSLSQAEQVRAALKVLECKCDDILTVSATGIVTRKRLWEPQTLWALPQQIECVDFGEGRDFGGRIVNHARREG